MEKLKRNNQIVLQYVNEKGSFSDYPWNPNGSENNIAGICDETERVFGTMPHPEVFLFSQNHPRRTKEKIQGGEGLKIFKNAVRFVKNKL